MQLTFDKIGVRVWCVLLVLVIVLNIMIINLNAFIQVHERIILHHTLEFLW